MKRKSKYNLCINDLILTAVIAVMAVILLIIFTIIKGNNVGNYLLITKAGEQYGIYELSRNQSIEIIDDNAKNILVIRDGAASMIEADCPDKYCVSSGTISKNGETIVCLPHRLVAEIIINNSSDDSGNYDVIAY